MTDTTLYCIHKEGIMAMDRDKLLTYLKNAVHPDLTEHKIGEMLDIYTLTPYCFPVKLTAGTKVAIGHGEICKIAKDTEIKKDLYYIVAPKLCVL